MLRDILQGKPHPLRIAKTIAAAEPDIIVLQNVDYDTHLHGLAALGDLIAQHGYALPHGYAPRPNSGWPTQLDLDGDGLAHGPRDAQGYGRFPGQRGLAILSAYPIAQRDILAYSATLWRDVAPYVGQTTLLSTLLSREAQAIQRLSSVAHVAVPISINGKTLTLLTHHATPPVFDGPEDRNGYRNAAENLLWLHILDGAFGPPPKPPYILAAMTNLDPWREAGRHSAIQHILESAWFQDPARHRDSPHRDTSHWPTPGPGKLRTSYLLPSPDIKITATGQLAVPESNDSLRSHPHRLIWIDISF